MKKMEFTLDPKIKIPVDFVPNYYLSDEDLDPVDGKP